MPNAKGDSLTTTDLEQDSVLRLSTETKYLTILFGGNLSKIAQRTVLVARVANKRTRVVLRTLLVLYSSTCTITCTCIFTVRKRHTSAVEKRSWRHPCTMQYVFVNHQKMKKKASRQQAAGVRIGDRRSGHRLSPTVRLFFTVVFIVPLH